MNSQNDFYFYVMTNMKFHIIQRLFYRWGNYACATTPH